MQALSAIAPILVILTPYIYGFHSQAPSRKWLRNIFDELTGEIPEALQNRKRAWFTDTLEDVNGVATTIRKMTAAGAAAGKELIVVTSRGELQIDDIPIKNFQPIGEFELPEYELQKLSFPPILQILDYIQREKFTEIIISTPGPIGLTGLLAGKMLNLQTSGIYHTDFPQYIRILTEDGYREKKISTFWQTLIGGCAMKVCLSSFSWSATALTLRGFRNFCRMQCSPDTLPVSSWPPLTLRLMFLLFLAPPTRSAMLSSKRRHPAFQSSFQIPAVQKS